MKQVVVKFTDKEFEKLRRLAERRKITIGEVLRGFAQTCKPEGGQWRHPQS